jgi:hypothetical protein
MLWQRRTEAASGSGTSCSSSSSSCTTTLLLLACTQQLAIISLADVTAAATRAAVAEATLRVEAYSQLVQQQLSTVLLAFS